MTDLFNSINNKNEQPTYQASDIEVLEGLEAVRKRPGMYIGGTDENALHHLVAEIFDNSMDEAVAGFANKITVEFTEDGGIKITDNGRGIPVDEHPKFPGKSALEIIATTLHSGGKFSNNVYQTSGGLHGVGLSVVNALSSYLVIEAVRDRILYRQIFERGIPTGPLKEISSVRHKSGTSIFFKPDAEIFHGLSLRVERIYKFIKSKAYLNKDIEIKWICPKDLAEAKSLPNEEIIRFPGGLKDYLASELNNSDLVVDQIFAGETILNDKDEKVEWAVTWTINEDNLIQSFCNTVNTTNGGVHENAFRNLLVKAIKDYGSMTTNKKVNLITSDDVINGISIIISLFIKNPQFQGQTKEKLVNMEIGKTIENVVKHHFDHWLSHNKKEAEVLLNYFIEKAEERISRKLSKEANKKASGPRLRLPVKLADCTKNTGDNELFIVEGDSAGGSAKQAREREYQAVMPLRGKILNVASNTQDKIFDNQQLGDLELALGCGVGKNYNHEKLRYNKIIIMTDADVDGAHIASLLMTYFFRQMPALISNNHLYLAKPPLYRIKVGNLVIYADSDEEKQAILRKNPKAEINRFKGLGEMTAAQLKETTMNRQTRSLYKVTLSDINQASEQVENLMGKKPELRFKFIKEQTLEKASFIKENLDL